MRLINETRYGDYVNASWVTNRNEKFSFIAAQSPLPLTVPHYLQMLEENKVSVIVTLTRDNEQDDANG